MSLDRRQLLKLGVAAGTLPLPGLYAQASTTLPYQSKKLYHGVCLYPELWPEEDIDRDIVEMKKLGINVVRMGEFIWSTVEPKEGKISYALLERVMDKLYAAGIDVVLCTPTATPPVWLTHNHPERLHKNAEGEILIHGARQHASYEHPAVRKACFRVIKVLAKTLGKHPSLIGWQIDNEMKAHVAEDFSEAAIKNWHKWLEKRFGSIDALNKAWGTHMWSQYYQRFDQVPAPLKTPFIHNASLSTAYKMFCRESVADFMKQQSDILKTYSDKPVTHNDNPAFNIHHERSMRAQDFASYDVYATSEQWGALVFRSDFYRAAIPGRPFWLMETSSAHNGWLGHHQVMHPKGFLTAEAAVVYSLGGEGFCYWLWRQQRTGAELPHSAVMSAWYKPGVGYSEVQKVGKLRERLEPLLIGTQVIAPEIAVTYSDHARAMVETEGFDKREGFPSRYRGVIELWHSIIRDEGYHREVRFEGADLTGLKVLFTPGMPYVSEEFARRIVEFVNAGGTWIAGPVTGTRGREHTVPTDAGLGLVDSLAGVTTNFIAPLTKTKTSGRALGLSVPLSGWCAAMTPDEGTKSIGVIESGALAGQCFISERQLGAGRVVILGAQPHGDEGLPLIKKLVNHYAGLAGVKQRYKASPGTIVCPRLRSDGSEMWMVVNMDGKGGELSLPAGVSDAETGEAVSNTLNIPSYQWRALILRGA
ncbi:beta-galactosidase [Alteromonadaceae bacterium Bs31]|nr:beta-galactosidase [Alteromonadaceae bacterium Bs31]